MPIIRKMRESKAMKIYPRADGTFAMPATPGYDNYSEKPILRNPVYKVPRTRKQRKKQY